jgi:hypothetical protein
VAAVGARALVSAMNRKTMSVHCPTIVIREEAIRVASGRLPGRLGQRLGLELAIALWRQMIHARRSEFSLGCG